LLKAAAIIVLTAICCFASNAHGQTPAATSPGNQSTGTPPAASVTPPTAPRSSPQPSANLSPRETPEALAHKYIDLWNSGDASAIAVFPDFIMHNHGGRVQVGSAMLGRVITTWRKSMPDLTFTIDDTVAQADKVVMRVTLKGTYKERLFAEAGDPASPPRLVRATGIFIFRAADGKIQEIWQELDEAILRTEMGSQWKTRTELGADKSKDQNESPSTVQPPKN
jgi:steroid delta-isomerase-like uncharacterized protein